MHGICGRDEKNLQSLVVNTEEKGTCGRTR